MYFWNVNALTQKLRNDTLSTREEAQQYFIIIFGFVLCTVLKLFSQQLPSEIGLPYTIATLIGSTLAIICGMSYCFYINKTGDGKGFIKRILCLTVPVTLRTFPAALQTFIYTTLLCIALIWPITLILQLCSCMGDTLRLPQTSTGLGTAFCILFIVIWVVTYYRCLSKELREIAH